MELKDLVGRFGSTVLETGKQVGAVVSEKAKEASVIAKDAREVSTLKSQAAECERILKDNYAILGEFYYSKFSENPSADMVEIVRTIGHAKDTLARIQARIDDIRTISPEETDSQTTSASQEEKSIDDELAAVKDNLDE